MHNQDILKRIHKTVKKILHREYIYTYVPILYLSRIKF